MIEKLVFPNTADVTEAAANLVIADLKEAVTARGKATWVIAGGTAPMAAYELLAAQPADILDWSKVAIVIGDERCVPFDSPDASWTQAERAFMHVVGVSGTTVRPPTDSSSEPAAGLYEQYVQSLPQNDAGLPMFDHVWLGVGEDGHTLSIFPNHPSFAEAESDRLVIAVHDSPKPPPERISLTFKALRGAKHCVIITAGAAKAPAIGRALAGDLSLPVARAAAVVEKAGGNVTWLLDEAAAGQI